MSYVCILIVHGSWRILDEKPERETMINHLFTALLPIANQLISNDDEEAYLMT